MSDDYRGVSLFTTVTDMVLRNRNRAMVMANMFEDNVTKEKRLSAKGTVLLLGYFKSIPEGERKGTYDILSSELTKRGFTFAH